MISVLIPWRTDGIDPPGHRQRVWDYLRPLWDATGLQVCVGVDDRPGPFSASYAFNRAAEQASGDRFALFGADHVPDPYRLMDISDHPWEMLFAETHVLDEYDTLRVLAGEIRPEEARVAERYAFSCGTVTCTRSAWDQLGGMDEEFRGWGGEDVAFTALLERAFGPAPTPTTPVRTLWHPPAPRDHAETNFARLRETYGFA